MKKHLHTISKYRPSALQGTLQLEVSRKRHGLAVEHPYERRALSLLFIMLAVLFVGYLYFVTSSILHVMGRTEAVREIQKIESTIGQLEKNYLALSQSVSPEAARALGLAPIEETSYVHRLGNAASAQALAANRI